LKADNQRMVEKMKVSTNNLSLAPADAMSDYFSFIDK
tara:strand:+ start:123 stop:233 length:111 start_codon:yes stop_codon:yes gene_type:complete